MSLCQQLSFIFHKAAESSFLRTHVTGVLSHGDGKAFAFIDKLEWPHDSNLTINILVNVLLKTVKVCKNKVLSDYSSNLNVLHLLISNNHIYLLSNFVFSM